MDHGKTLILGYGNPGRLDDGLGPALADAVARELIEGVDVLSDYQLGAEHAAEISGYDRVVFADATVVGEEAFFLQRLLGRAAVSFSSHSMRPESVVALAEECLGWRGRAYLLGIRGVEFDAFGERLSEPAREHLEAATRWVTDGLRSGDVGRYVTGEAIRDSVIYSTGGGECTTASM